MSPLVPSPNANAVMVVQQQQQGERAEPAEPADALLDVCEGQQPIHLACLQRSDCPPHTYPEADCWLSRPVLRQAAGSHSALQFQRTVIARQTVTAMLVSSSSALQQSLSSLASSACLSNLPTEVCRQCGRHLSHPAAVLLLRTVVPHTLDIDDIDDDQAPYELQVEGDEAAAVHAAAAAAAADGAGAGGEVQAVAAAAVAAPRSSRWIRCVVHLFGRLKFEVHSVLPWSPYALLFAVRQLWPPFCRWASVFPQL